MSSHFKRTLAVATPLILSQFIYTLSGFLGMLMLAGLGHDVLAASGLLFSTELMIRVVVLSPLFSLSVIVAQSVGRNALKEIGNLVQQAWWLAAIIAILMIALYHTVPFILQWFGQDPQLVSLITPYFKVAIFGLPALVINACNSMVLNGIGKQKMNALFTVLQVIVTLLTGYLFIYGHAGLPTMGVAGWGIAFACGMWAQLIATCTYFLTHHTFKQYHLLKKHSRNGWQHLKQIMQIGWPMVIQTGGELLSFSFITYMVGWLGIIPLAASQVVMQYLMLMLIPAFGLSMAGGVLVGRNMGAKNYTEAFAFGRSSVILSFIMMLIIGTLLLLFSNQLAHFYIKNSGEHYDNLLHIIRILFVISVIAQVFDTLRNTLTGVLRGTLDTKIPMWVGLITIWLVRVPLAYLFGFILHWGVYGISLSAVPAMFIGAYLLWNRWQAKMRKLIG